MTRCAHSDAWRTRVRGDESRGCRTSRRLNRTWTLPCGAGGRGDRRGRAGAETAGRGRPGEPVVPGPAGGCEAPGGSRRVPGPDVCGAAGPPGASRGPPYLAWACGVLGPETGLPTRGRFRAVTNHDACPKLSHHSHEAPPHSPGAFRRRGVFRRGARGAGDRGTPPQGGAPQIGVEPPHRHDVSPVLLECRERLPQPVQEPLGRIVEISR